MFRRATSRRSADSKINALISRSNSYRFLIVSNEVPGLNFFCDGINKVEPIAFQPVVPDESEILKSLLFIGNFKVLRNEFGQEQMRSFSSFRK